MLSLLSALSSASKFRRTYVFSSGDSFSAKKAVNFETHMRQKDDPTKQSKTSSDSTYTLLEIPRARNVGQSWLTTPWSCIICILGCLRAFNSGGAPPDLVVCNGPGSAVMMVAVCFLYKVCLPLTCLWIDFVLTIRNWDSSSDFAPRGQSTSNRLLGSTHCRCPDGSCIWLWIGSSCSGPGCRRNSGGQSIMGFLFDDVFYMRFSCGSLRGVGSVAVFPEIDT